MRKDIFAESSHSSTSAIDTQVLPDPWELASPSSEVKPSQASRSWQMPMEDRPLINPSGSPNALCLGSPKFNPRQVLLQDWLKLRSEEGKSLAIQLREALGLLYWIEGTTG